MKHSEKATRSKHYTRGGQITLHNIRMLFQINKAVFGSYLLFIFLMTILFICWMTSYELFYSSLYYIVSKTGHFIGFNDMSFNVPYHGSIYNVSQTSILSSLYFEKSFKTFYGIVLKSISISTFISFLTIVFLVLFLIRKGKNQSSDVFIRGASISSSKKVKKMIINNGEASDIKIEGMPLIKNAEVQHMLVHGTVGTGKSQLIRKLLTQIKKRGDRAIIYDKGCSFIQNFFDETIDIILNPFDERCAKWDMWQEAPSDADFENMATSLLPIHGETDPFWVNAARTVFASSASKMRTDPDRSIKKLMSLLITGEFEDLEPYLKGTAAATLVSGKIEKTAISIRSVLTTYLKSLQNMSLVEEEKKKSFSIRDYILNEESSGWLFISSDGEKHTSLKPLISMWLSIASFALLSLKENRDRRIWFICDELPSLHRLPMLGETIAEVRKFGGCFVLGMQSFSQLGKVYGRDAAKELFDLLNTRFFFRSPSSEMARLVSSEIGEHEFEDSKENYSYGANTIRDGISVGTNRIIQPLVSYPEIMSLDDMSCYLKLPGNYPVVKFKLAYERPEKIAKGFIPVSLSSSDKEETEESDEFDNEHQNREIGAMDEQMSSSSNQSEKFPQIVEEYFD